MSIYSNCLAYSSKSNYVSYLNKLDKESLKKEYCLNCNLDDNLKYHYNYFKSYIYLHIIDKAKKALYHTNTDYKSCLYNLILDLKKYFDDVINPYFQSIRTFNDQNSKGYCLDDITPESLITIYDSLYEESSSFGSGSYNAIQSLVNLISNNIRIKLFHLYNEGENTPSQLKLFPKYLIGEQNKDGSWEYKSCLELFICNLISWFDIIESYYYN